MSHQWAWRRFWWKLYLKSSGNSNREEGTTILLVEQNALMALSIAHRGYVLQNGQIVIDDTAVNLKRNEMVRAAYLGVK